MPIRCPRGTKVRYRYRKIRMGKQRIGGCARKGRFVKIKEVKTIKKGKVIRKKIK